ncbi:MAG: FkbM family methyltransferase [Sphingosinicella sp.]|uniref:FkbM family methyltransferase n=1 Tax=Sphingosinicella sp. TaxID=1917971 RepID=UPI0040377070
MNALGLIERVLGRRLMWKIGRRLYLHARREGSLDMESNGEANLLKALAKRAAREGRTLNVVDIGANLGSWSTSLMEALQTAGAPRARLTLFEPVPAIRATLTDTMQGWASFADIVIEPMALSDQHATMTMMVTGPSTGTHHLQADLHNFEGQAIDVSVTTFDAYMHGRKTTHIDFIKIDAEGFDPKVIVGMEDLLARGGVDLIQFEYSILFVRSRAYLADLFARGARHGYVVALLSQQGIELFPAWHPDLERFYASPMLLVRDGWSAPLPAWEGYYEADNTRR